MSIAKYASYYPPLSGEDSEKEVGGEGGAQFSHDKLEEPYIQFLYECALSFSVALEISHNSGAVRFTITGKHQNIRAFMNASRAWLYGAESGINAYFH